MSKWVTSKPLAAGFAALILVVCGCAKAAPVFHDLYPERDPRFILPTPPGEEENSRLSEEFCKTHKWQCKYAMVYLWTTDEKGRWVKDITTGEYAISGLIFSPTFFGDDPEKPLLINPCILFEKPATRSTLKNVRIAKISADNIIDGIRLSREILADFLKIAEKGLKEGATPDGKAPVLEVPPELRARLIQELKALSGLTNIDEIIRNAQKRAAAKNHQHKNSK